MGKTDEELEPYEIGKLVEVSVPTGELIRWDGCIGVIMSYRKIVEKQLELPDNMFSDQENFRNLNCWEYELLLCGKTRWFTHYSLLPCEDDLVS